MPVSADVQLPMQLFVSFFQMRGATGSSASAGWPPSVSAAASGAAAATSSPRNVSPCMWWRMRPGASTVAPW